MADREKRILVVDDDDAIRALLVTVLRRRGFLVDSARDGEAAETRLARCRYTMLLLDLMMPRKSGWEVLETLAKQPGEERPLVIVLTAGTELRSFPAGLVAGTFRKPFDIDVLVDAVAACIGALTAQEQREGCPAAESDRSDKESGNVN